MDLTREHDLMFELLLTFKEVCEKNSIWYSLAYGSLLGAVRHNGFIPWDNDADVFLMLPDKERFRDAFEKHDTGRVKLRNCDTETRCLQSHDSLYLEDEKIHLDIYLLVGAPSDFDERKRFTFKSHYLDRIIRSKYVDIKKVKRKNIPLVIGAKFVDHLFSDETLRKNIKSRETQYDFDTAEYLVDLGCDGGPDGCIPKRIFLSMIDSEFNGVNFKIPQNYDEYLRRTYGDDYMTPKKY